MKNSVFTYRAVGGRRMAVLAGLVGAVLTAGRSAAAQAVPGTRVEYRSPRYGGYLPYGGYPADSGAPLGGYTPFGRGEPSGGWLKLDYGLRGDDFAHSYHFGDDTLDGLSRGTVSDFIPRPNERGRGRWDSYGRAGVNPPPVDTTTYGPR